MAKRLRRTRMSTVRLSSARRRTGRLRSGKSRRARGLRSSAYRTGWEYGYHHGRAQAVVRAVNADRNLPIYPLRIMYITSGLGLPYTPLDQVIADSIDNQVYAFTVASPTDDCVKLAREFRPDAVIVLDGVQRMAVEQIAGLRSLGIKTAAWFVDDPYYTDLTTSMAFNYDLVFTIELSCFHLYQQLGHQGAHYLPLGVHPRLFAPLRTTPAYHSDICFIGTAFWNRVNFFDSVMPYLHNRKFRIIGLWWDRMKHYHTMKRDVFLNRWLSPEETAKYYNGAKIVVNLHRSHDDTTYNSNSRRIPALSLNPRTFEIAACGAFQLSDVRSDVSRFFQPGREIETFSSAEEFVHKVNLYLANREARQTVALQGLARTLAEHTFGRRIAEMLRIISQA